MSDFYEVPVKSEDFDAADAVRVRVIEAGNAASKMIKDWMNAYDKFWMTPLTHGDRALTKVQTQAMLDENKPLIGSILSDSAGFRDFLQASHADKIGEDKLIPNRYFSTPYDMDENLVLTSDLKAEWEASE
jgi:hypothetical protein